MSNIIKKAEEALTGHHNDSAGGSNNGPHNSKLANKLDPRVDSDRDNRARHEVMGGTAGPHSSNVANNQIGTTGAHGGSIDPYNPNVVDPRVDSVGADNLTRHPGPRGGAYGPTGVSSTTTNAGPHGSNLANKIDPRVDSDIDNRARHQDMGGAAGPHGSNIANKIDPRVDSDRDNRAAQFGSPGNYQIGTTGAHGGGIDPYNPNVANKLDPRVDPVGADNLTRHPGPRGGAYEPTGASSTTTNAGPHGSKLVNKLDPRVDSELDNRNAGVQRIV